MYSIEKIYECQRGCGWRVRQVISNVHPKTDWGNFADLVGHGIAQGEFSRCSQCGGPVKTHTKAN